MVLWAQILVIAPHAHFKPTKCGEQASLGGCVHLAVFVLLWGQIVASGTAISYEYMEVVRHVVVNDRCELLDYC